MATKPKPSEEVLRALFTRGLNPLAAAKELGTSNTSVIRWWGQLGLLEEKPTTVKKAAALFADGYVARQVACMLNVTEAYADKLCRRWQRDQAGPIVDVEARTRELFLANASIRETARAVNKDYSFVQGRFEKWNRERVVVDFDPPSAAYLRLAEFDPIVRRALAKRRGEPEDPPQLP